MDTPLHKTGGLTILRGSLAPEGAVVKSAGLDDAVVEGRAKVFDDERFALDALTSDTIRPGDAVVIRYEGPHGGPGMREMLAITDGRFSGGTTGPRVGHVAPEASKGGPLAMVRDGDAIRLDMRTRSLDLLIDADELARRRQSWSPPPPRYPTGALAKYARLVGSAAGGAVCE